MLWGQTLLARSFAGLIQRLPWRAAGAVGSTIGRAAPFVIRQRQQLAEDNLRQAFPEMAHAQRARSLRAMWGHLGRAAAEFTKIPQLSPDVAARYVTLAGFHHVDQALALGRGVIFLTAHCGSWELMAQGTVLRGYRAAVVVRPLHHPVVNRIVNRIRESHGLVLIPHRQAVREGIRRLRQNWTLGILMDQAFADGMPVSFFGRAASTTSIISQLARRTGAAVIPVHNYREGHRIRVVAQPPLLLDASVPVEQAIQRDVEQFNRVIEEWIRAHPDQWFWVHNRWKGVPSTLESAPLKDTSHEHLSVHP